MTNRTCQVADNRPNYKVGDEVLCIDASSEWTDTTIQYVRLGATYIVAALQQCCGISLVQFFGIAHENGSHCRLCLTVFNGETWFPAWRFIKLDGLTEDQTTENEVTA